MTRRVKILLFALMSTAAAYGSSINWGIVPGMTVQGGPFPSQVINPPNYPIPVNTYSSGTLSGSGTDTSSESTVSATGWMSMTQDASGNEFFHAYADTNGTCLVSPNCTPASGGVLFSMYWDDAITIGGLPDGTPVELSVTIFLNSQTSSIVPAGDAAKVQAQIGIGSLNLLIQNINGSLNGVQTTNGVVDTAAGQTLFFTAGLEGYAVAETYPYTLLVRITFSRMAPTPAPL